MDHGQLRHMHVENKWPANSILILQIRQMAGIDVDGEVWKLKFAKFGSVLAASILSASSSSVCVWELRPTASEAASWVLQSKIIGGASANADQVMLEG